MEVLSPVGNFCVGMSQAGLTQKWEAAGMSSMEGEYVEFGHAVYLEGPVEVIFLLGYTLPTYWEQRMGD